MARIVSFPKSSTGAFVLHVLATPWPSRVLAAFAVTFASAACSVGFVATYHVAMPRVDRVPQAEERFGAAEVAEFTIDDSTAFVFEDGLFRITWDVELARLPFVLENKTDQLIRIIWDEVIFVDLNGAPHKVMHRDIRYPVRGEPMNPTTIDPGETLEDYILAIHLAYQESDASWREDPFLTPSRRATREELEPARANIGRTFAVVLPLEFEGQTDEYVFTFRVTDVELP